MATGTLDSKILRWAGYKSPSEISELLGGVLSAEEVASRLQELLSEKDWITLLQRKQLIILRLEEIVDRYWGWALDGSVKSFQAVVLPAIQEIRKMVAEDRDQLETAMLKISNEQARVMGQAIAASFELLLKELDVPEEKANEVLPLVLKPAFAAVESAATVDS